MSNGLDPVQDRHSVDPDLGPNCLQRLSADDKRVKDNLSYNLKWQSIQGSMVDLIVKKKN